MKIAIKAAKRAGTVICTSIQVVAAFGVMAMVALLCLVIVGTDICIDGCRT